MIDPGRFVVGGLANHPSFVSETRYINPGTSVDEMSQGWWILVEIIPSWDNARI